MKRQKNDAADAEAICEAAQPPSMRFVPVKTEAQQAAALAFRGRDLLVRQRTQISNALRGHMAEYGWIALKGLAHLEKLAALLADPSAVPADVRAVCTVLLESLAVLDRQIALLDKEIVRRSREDEVARRLMTIPGIGPITATAIAALAPPPETFAKGRDFAAWVGLNHVHRVVLHWNSAHHYSHHPKAPTAFGFGAATGLPAASWQLQPSADRDPRCNGIRPGPGRGRPA